MSYIDYDFSADIQHEIHHLIKAKRVKKEDILVLQDLAFDYQSFRFEIPSLLFHRQREIFEIDELEDVHHSYFSKDERCPFCHQEKTSICSYFQREYLKTELIDAINAFYKEEKKKFEAEVIIEKLQMSHIVFRKEKNGSMDENEYVATIDLTYTHNGGKEKIRFPAFYSKSEDGWSTCWYINSVQRELYKSIFRYHEEQKDEVYKRLHSLLKTIEEKHIIPNEMLEMEILKPKVKFERLSYDKTYNEIEIYFRIDGTEELLYFYISMNTRNYGWVRIVDDVNESPEVWDNYNHFDFLCVNECLLDWFREDILKDTRIRLKYLLRVHTYNSELYEKIKQMI